MLTAEEVKEQGRLGFIKAIHESEAFCCFTPTESLAEALEAMEENTREAIAYAQRWNDLMERLGTVPQLFIAV